MIKELRLVLSGHTTQQGFCIINQSPAHKLWLPQFLYQCAYWGSGDSQALRMQEFIQKDSCPGVPSCLMRKPVFDIYWLCKLMWPSWFSGMNRWSSAWEFGAHLLQYMAPLHILKDLTPTKVNLDMVENEKYKDTYKLDLKVEYSLGNWMVYGSSLSGARLLDRLKHILDIVWRDKRTQGCNVGGSMLNPRLVKVLTVFFFSFIFFVPGLLRNNWQICMFLTCTTWFDVHIHYERITTIRLIKTSITSHCWFFFFFAVRTLKIYSQKISSIEYHVINYSHHAVH